jgi:hypothetical protein
MGRGIQKAAEQCSGGIERNVIQEGPASHRKYLVALIEKSVNHATGEGGVRTLYQRTARQQPERMA